MESFSNKLETVKSLWSHPWQVKENSIAAASVLATGSVLGILSNGIPIHPLSIPYNLYLGFFFLALLIFLHINFRKSLFGKWLSSPPAAMTSVLLFAMLLLAMIVIPQDTDNGSKFLRLTGLSHVKSSFLFILTEIFLLSTLGMVTLRRSYPIRGKNLIFFLNHFGLFLALLAGILGAGDVKRLTINLLKGGDESSIAITQDGEMEALPFAVKLVDFSMTFSDSSVTAHPVQITSLVVVKSDSMHLDTTAIGVNRPLSVNGWKVYQTGFDQSKGKYSSLSILSAVRDPWMPLVYAGLLLVMAGMVIGMVKSITKLKINCPTASFRRAN